MKRWEATGNNSDNINEDDINWDLVKDKVKSLQLNNNGQIIRLPDNMEYVQGKTASAFINSGKVQIESRYVGVKIGNNIVKIRVDERTNDISIEVEDDPNYIPNPE
jgi:putative transposon-encoded protein